MTWEPFWAAVKEIVTSNGFTTILGSFLGAVFGIPAGMRVNERHSSKQEKERKRQLLGAISQAVNHNDYLVGEIWTHFFVNSPQTIPTFNVDLTVLDATAGVKYEVLDIGLCRGIDQLRYELSHLARKVDTMFFLQSKDVAYSGPAGHYSTVYGRLYREIVGGMKEHIPEIQKLGIIYLTGPTTRCSIAS